MKSEKGVTLTSLIIYIIAMLIVMSTIAVITSSVYNNLDVITNESNSQKEFSRFNMCFIKEVNLENNAIKKIDEENHNYIVFSDNEKTHQYTFLNNSIYLNKIKICDNVTDCKFYIYEDEVKNVAISVSLKIGQDLEKELIYSLK